ncbi:MAG TPA: hypothetical protein VGY98_08345 [Verrucomicrobiae bacterium]|nr:hypothetical protein [Verrucomicrobiae bacterium]
MKTRNILTTLGAVTVAAMAFNFNASAALLSPRAAGNEIMHTARTNNDPNLVVLGVTSGEFAAYASPRASGNQVAVVAGTNNEVNPAVACAKTMNGTPKAIEACVSQTTMPGCKLVTVAPLK